MRGCNTTSTCRRLPPHACRWPLCHTRAGGPSATRVQVALLRRERDAVRAGAVREALPRRAPRCRATLRRAAPPCCNAHATTPPYCMLTSPSYGLPPTCTPHLHPPTAPPTAPPHCTPPLHPPTAPPHCRCVRVRHAASRVRCGLPHECRLLHRLFRVLRERSWELHSRHPFATPSPPLRHPFATASPPLPPGADLPSTGWCPALTCTVAVTSTHTDERLRRTWQAVTGLMPLAADGASSTLRSAAARLGSATGLVLRSRGGRPVAGGRTSLHCGFASRRWSARIGQTPTPGSARAGLAPCVASDGVGA